MAGNGDSGKVLAFKMTEKELEKLIDAYKQDTESGVIPRASWPHFCARLGYTEQEVEEVIERGESRTSAYYGRAVMLKRVLTWIRGEMLSGAGWGGQNQSKAIFALKQNHGDGMAYSDSDRRGGNKKQSVQINFGGNDKRAKNAMK